MIPTPDLLGLYYASCDLPSSGADAPDRIVGTGATQMVIPLTNVSEPNAFWNGATGYFSGTGTSATLRGVPFHVRSWNGTAKTLTLAAPLPIAPVAGDVLKLFKGGKYASNQEILAMKISGKQPEIEGITGPNVTGVTIKKASALLGEGTLSVYYVSSTKALSIRMGTSGNYGPETFLTGDAANVAVYNSDLSGFILVDVLFSALRTSNTYTDTYTLSFPKGNFIPNYEGYETNDGFGRTRYHLAVLKNKATDPLDAMAALSIWTGKPAGANTTCSAAYTPSYTAAATIGVANASTWPTRGYWIRNRTRNDLRYVDYRSGNTLYVKAILWAVLSFKSGATAITPGMAITSAGTDSAIVDQVTVTSGSWSGGNATGELRLKKVVGQWYADNPIRVDGLQHALASATIVRGFRGTTAQSWVNGDVLELASDLDLGINYPSGGFFKDPISDTIAPDGIAFNLCQSQEEAAIVDCLMGEEMAGIWVRQNILDGTQARADLEGDLNISWF
ncbi:MAG: hypothetical protein LBI05_09195 [Planctomycetaceae bacterium]|jgi:hypothetical protein|nr:hypothetical protein [Planctomycetaceae bacterium]